ncbi:hypothetical protein V6W11_11715 [Micromonospora profundi]|uniref:hypothetical protein n=1 Tax=Micromonospora profundi TaxID=1420889 RepID=UPI002FEFD0DF
MADRDGTDEAPLRVWRRSTERAAAPADEPKLFCGGPDRTVDEIFEEMRERKRQWDEERERQKAEAESERTDKKKGDADDQAAVDRFRNDRYAVKLLRQDTTAWGDGPSLSGTLG